MPIRIAIIGYGKIAQDQHLPAIAADPRFDLVAAADPHDAPEGVQSFTDYEQLIGTMAGKLDAVAICTPPGVRYQIARDALDAGLHVLLEKPPSATLGEIEHLEIFARQSGRTLFTAWHAQHNPAVTEAAKLLAGKTIHSLAIQWFEDVRKWHPDQEWIWAPGGFGIFDPGINALSIATRILPMPLFVRSATLSFPSNKQTPIAAAINLTSTEGPMSAEMDWRHAQGECWTIRVETGEGQMLELLNGGETLLVDGRRQTAGGSGEYLSLYDRFAALIESGKSEVDSEPLRIVADIFMVGRRELVEPFV